MAIGSPANSDVPRTAAGWLVAFGEWPDDARLQARFQEWLAADPAHARDWAEMNLTLRAIGLTEPLHRDAWDGSLHRPRHGRRRWAVGISAAAAALVALVTGPQLALRLQADQVTGAGEQRTIRLADGSTVRLAPRSAIAVADDGRRVELLKGEAFFAVVHDDTHPFGVTAGRVAVTDIGTMFDIRLGTGATDIGVKEGEVQVDTARSPTAPWDRLGAGDWMRVSSAGVERGRAAADEIATWTQGQLIAKNRPVAEVVDELRPYFSGLIVLSGDVLARQPLTGVYNLSDPAGALAAVARAQGASLRRISPWLIVISGR